MNLGKNILSHVSVTQDGEKKKKRFYPNSRMNLIHLIISCPNIFVSIFLMIFARARTKRPHYM